jgi:hypothetical protein
MGPNRGFLPLEVEVAPKMRDRVLSRTGWARVETDRSSESSSLSERIWLITMIGYFDSETCRCTSRRTVGSKRAAHVSGMNGDCVAQTGLAGGFEPQLGQPYVSVSVGPIASERKGPEAVVIDPNQPAIVPSVTGRRDIASAEFRIDPSQHSWPTDRTSFATLTSPKILAPAVTPVQ